MINTPNPPLKTSNQPKFIKAHLGLTSNDSQMQCILLTYPNAYLGTTCVPWQKNALLLGAFMIGPLFYTF